MIIARLRGGMGNQLFQAAAGLALARKFNVPLKVDQSWLRAYNYMHIYGLGNLKLNPEIASDWEVRKFSCWYFPTPIGTRAYYKFHDHLEPKPQFSFFKSKTVFVEPHFHYSPKFESIKDPMMIDGFYQTEKYFLSVREDLIQLCQSRHAPSAENLALITKIKSSESVGVHVRRGDYVNNARIQAIHGSCSNEYYLNGIASIRSRIPSAKFFFFSDEPEWVKSNLATHPDDTVISHNGSKYDYEDLKLMSACRHNIIANSSFSWWGAWLNNNPNKIVIAPKNWFRASQFSDIDIIPPSWERLF